MSTSKDWVVWCNSKKEGEEDHRFEHHGKNLFSSYDEKKSKVGDEQEKKKKKNAGQSVRYRWWKQGNVKIAASRNHANCWVHKDFPYTANNVETIREAFEACSSRCSSKSVRTGANSLTRWQIGGRGSRCASN